MPIVCGTCGAVTRVQLSPAREALVCGHCGTHGPPQAQHVTAGARPRREPVPLATAGPEMDLLAPSYDPGFDQAIAEGQLTLRQAMERGNRRQLASAIAARHDLPIHLALDVVDNRRTILAALEEVRGKRKRASRKRAKSQPERPGRRAFPWTATALGFAVLVSSAGGWWYFGRWDEGGKPSADPTRLTLQESEQMLAARESTRTEIRRDGEGRVTRVIGADPLSVLTTYCESRPETDSSIVPVEVVQPFPEAGDLRIGLFREQDDEAMLGGIAIHEDHSTHRWIAGDGEKPVSPIDPHHLPRR